MSCDLTLKWEEPKDPTDQDFYEVEIRAGWLGEDIIQNVTFMAEPASGLNFATAGIQGNIARTFVTGGNPGTWPVEVTITTASGRVRQRSVTLEVAEQ